MDEKQVSISKLYKTASEMTKEEILDGLYRLRSEIYVYMPPKWIIPMENALDKAIEAIKQEPCADCVSRSQALKELEESAKHHANDSREEVLLRRDRDIIRALPAVTPTRCIAAVHFSKEDLQEIVNEKVQELIIRGNEK